MIPDHKLLFPRPTAEEVLANLTEFFFSPKNEALADTELQARKSVINELKGRVQRKSIGVDDIAGVLRFSKSGLNALLSLLGLSQERFLGILILKQFEGKPTGTALTMPAVISRIRKSTYFASQVAALLCFGKNDPDLQGRVPPFDLAKFDQSKLQLENDALIDSLLRLGLKGRMDARKGGLLEDNIEEVLHSTGVEYTKGEITVPGLSRKLDFIIPNIQTPYLFIESGLFETTARELSDKARVEAFGCDEIEKAYPHARFIRVSDGVGWLRRGGNDLANVIASSHYFLVFKTLHKLIDIVNHYVPRDFFKERLDEDEKF